MKTKKVKQIIAFVLFAVAVVCCVFGVMGLTSGSSPNEARNGVAYVQEILRDTNGNIVSGGSGTAWALGTPGQPVQYFVTNGHVVQDAYIGPYQYEGYTGTVQLFFSAAENDFVQTEVVYYSAPAAYDIAILKIPSPTTKRTALTIRDSDSVQPGTTATALGFPGVSDVLQSNVRYDTSDVTMTKGIISKRASMTNQEYEAFQMDVEINGGNSGGPLVDDQGNVIGINTLSLVTLINGNVKVNTGVNYAIIADELTKILRREEIPYTKAGYKDWMTYTFFPIAIVALAAGIILLTTGKKKAVAGSAAAADSAAGARAAADNALGKKPVLRGVTGKYAGQSFDLSKGKVTIGRNAVVCNIVYDKDAPGISGNHCQLSYDANEDCFLLTDNGSTYGTFLGNGKKLAAMVTEKLTAGDGFYLSDTGNRFIVTKE